MSGNACSLNSKVSKVCIPKTRLTKLKTKKIKLKLKMLEGLQPIYLVDERGMSPKSSCATPCHFKKLKRPFRKTSRGKFLDLKLARFAVRIAAFMENNRSIVEEFGKGML